MLRSEHRAEALNAQEYLVEPRAKIGGDETAQDRRLCNLFLLGCCSVHLDPGNSREDHRVARWPIPCRSGRTRQSIYDGVIRIGPAIPPGWDFEGSVYVRGKTRVDVQMRRGEILAVVIDAGTTGPVRFRNPWPGETVNVVAGKANAKLVSSDSSREIQFEAVAGTSYLIEKFDTPATALSFAPVSGTPAREAKKLGSVQIGLFRDESELPK